VLWLPNGKLVPVHVEIEVADTLSGPSGFTLAEIADSKRDVVDDVVAFAIATADTDGALRAQRMGSGDGRTYTLTYTATDRAGNTASCTTTVTVPHDQRR